MNAYITVHLPGPLPAKAGSRVLRSRFATVCAGFSAADSEGVADEGAGGELPGRVWSAYGTRQPLIIKKALIKHKSKHKYVTPRI